MTIYIYGSKSFKNNIHEVLERANMKFRLSDDDSIEELDTLEELKDAIEENPKNIFLIDDDKIIKKNSLNNKIKFLKPKNGIEEEFLKGHGIGELSVDDIDDIATQIIRKLKKSQASKEPTQESTLEEQVLQESSENSEFEFVNGIQENEDAPQKTRKQEKFEKDEERDMDSFLYDNEPKNQDANDEHENEDEDDDFNIDDMMDFGEEDENDDKMNQESSDEDDEIFDALKNDLSEYRKSFDEALGVKRKNENSYEDEEKSEYESEEANDFEEENTKPAVEVKNNHETKPLQEEDFGLTIEKIEQKGEQDMSDDFSELDSLNENELLEALSGACVPSNTSIKSQESPKKASAEVELNSSSIHDLSSLITQLLNNKTLEITIKIKE